MIYPTYLMAMPKTSIKTINQINFEFIWKKKTHYIKKGNLTKPFEEDGLQAIDFETLNATLKLNCLKSFLKNKHNFWFRIPNYIFSKLGGMAFILRCDFQIKKLPVKLSLFHQQVLLYWKMIYTIAITLVPITHQFGIVDTSHIEINLFSTKTGWKTTYGLCYIYLMTMER